LIRKQERSNYQGKNSFPGLPARNPKKEILKKIRINNQSRLFKAGFLIAFSLPISKFD
jgi:hypothetical protein